MAQSAVSTLVDVQKVDIDQVNVGGTSTTKSSTAQTLNALTPLLTVLITAIGLVLTSCLQLVQKHTDTLQKVDTDWRAAVEKISLDEDTAANGVFEMQSFFDDSKYGEQAKTIAAAVLPSVSNTSEFDAAFFELLGYSNQRNQEQIISIARNVSNQIRESCNDFAISARKDSGFCDRSIGDFVINPQRYFSEEKQSDQIKKVLTETWKLDSVDGGQSALWQNQRFKPAAADLSGLIFYNTNLEGIDLTATSMDGVVFTGNCKVDMASLPKTLPPPQCIKK